MSILLCIATTRMNIIPIIAVCMHDDEIIMITNNNSMIIYIGSYTIFVAACMGVVDRKTWVLKPVRTFLYALSASRDTKLLFYNYS